MTELSEIIEKHQIDLIHSHFGYLHRILVQNRRKLNVKVIFHDHMDYSWGSSVLKQKFQQMIYAVAYRFNGIGVISVMEKKSNGYRLCGKKHWYVPNGLSRDRYVAHSMTREECREELGIKSSEKFCFFLGWDTMRKGLDVAMKAVELCQHSGAEFVLGVVGFGPNPSQQQLDKLENLTGVNPSHPYIRFLKSSEDMFAYHRAADVYLSASRFEAFSYGVLEAISQNVPIVVSNIEGTQWSWNYTKCSVFENGNAEACAEALQEAVVTRWDESNGEQIVDEYSIEKWCDRILDIYNKM
ncbi:MAG: glycosyltransferase [Lachnospiraceae bacterium]|nr:glycosyltransferase [Lachnospiraceae bacterium]